MCLFLSHYQLHHFPIRFPSIFPAKNNPRQRPPWRPSWPVASSGKRLWRWWTLGAMEAKWVETSGFPGFSQISGCQKSWKSTRCFSPSRAIAFSCLKNMLLNSMVGRYNEPVFMGFINQIITGGVYNGNIMKHGDFIFKIRVNVWTDHELWWFIGILTGI